MIARCAQCRETFSTDKYGRQTCPLCGAEVYVGKPGETPPPPPAAPSAWGGPPPEPGAGTAGGGAPFPPGGPALPPIGGESGPPPGGGPPQDQRTPFEEKGFAGYGETLKLALFEPAKLFERMRVDDAKGALAFGWTTTTAALIIGQLLTKLLVPDMTETVRQFLPEEARDALTKYPQPGLLSALITTPLFVLIGIYLTAAVVHVMLLLLSKSNRGFNATFRAVCYGGAPAVAFAIPQCGDFVAMVWWIGLTIFALAKTQRISGGSAAAAVLVPIVGMCCVLCGCIAAMVAAFGAAASH